jgi:hypothetical protein
MIGILENLLQDRIQLLNFYRLVDILESALVHRLDIGLYSPVCGNHDDIAVRIALIEFLEENDPVHLRHIDIGYYKIYFLLPEIVESFIAIADTLDNVPFPLKQTGKSNPGVFFVINYQYPFCLLHVLCLR